MNEDSKNYFENLANGEPIDQAVNEEAIPVSSLAKSANVHIAKTKIVDSELDFFDNDFLPFLIN